MTTMERSRCKSNTERHLEATDLCACRVAPCGATGVGSSRTRPHSCHNPLSRTSQQSASPSRTTAARLARDSFSVVGVETGRVLIDGSKPTTRSNCARDSAIATSLVVAAKRPRTTVRFGMDMRQRCCTKLWSGGPAPQWTTMRGRPAPIAGSNGRQPIASAGDVLRSIPMWITPDRPAAPIAFRPLRVWTVVPAGSSGWVAQARFPNPAAPQSAAVLPEGRAPPRCARS